MSKKEDNYSEDTIDLRTVFRLFLKRKWWFIGTVIVVAILGMLYMLSKPIIYEVKYEFSLEDDFLPDDYLIYGDRQEIHSRNEAVFIGIEDIELLFETDLIFRSLDEIEEIDDYNIYINSHMVDLFLGKDAIVFELKVKNTDKKLANDIAKNLIESLGTGVMSNDLNIFDNTLEIINEDLQVLEEENRAYEEKIAIISKEIKDMYSELNQDGSSFKLSDIHYDLIEKKAKLLLYEEKIIDNENEMKKLDGVYQLFMDEKNKVHNRIKIIEANPDYDIENNRAINSIIVILLSLLTGMMVVLAVNYIYKLKKNRNI